MTYLFDTNILLHFLRNSAVKAQVVANFAPLAEGNKSVLSVVSMGEIKSISIQNNRGRKRQKELEGLYEEFIITDINAKTVIQRYAEIDAFNQGKLPGKLLGMTARNMGKNDLWIAATASVLNIALLTTDNDFDHLAGTFFQLEKIVSV